MAAPELIDRLPPHSPEGEQAVLGCCLLDPAQAIGFCVESFVDGEGTFYDLRHQTIFMVLAEMFDAREPVDLITLQQKLKDRGYLDEVGGIAYLSSLKDCVPSAANLEYYGEIVLEKATLRKMIRTCTEAVAQAYDFEGEVEPLLDRLESSVLKIRPPTQSSGLRRPRDLVKDSMQSLQSLYERRGGISGIATGFMDLDKMTDGLHPGEMFILAARPSQGKTSLLLNIAENVCLDQKLPVGIFSLEMTAESLMTRLICSRSRVNVRNVRDGFLGPGDFQRLTSAAGALSQAPIYIDDTAGLSIMQLRAKARRLWQQYGIKLLGIDYLQLLHSTAPRAKENRSQEIADISAGIKALAKELNIPVLVACQLNREVERRGGGRPRLSELREGGSLEQDADVVGLLYDPQPEKESDEADQSPDQTGAQPKSLYIAKQRNGPTGDVNLTFIKGLTRFESSSKLSGDDIPEPKQQSMDP